MTRLGLSARAVDRILKVSRTIADVEDCDAISSTEVAEEVGYRSLTALVGSQHTVAAKLLIRLGKSEFLGPGKATTRFKRRITPALRVPDLALQPRGVFEGKGAASLKQRTREMVVPNKW